MSYHVTHVLGQMEPLFPLDRFGELLDELMVSADAEHTDVSVGHETGWTLSVFRSGFVVLESVEEGDPMHMGPVGHNECIALMSELARGEVDAILRHNWTLGYHFSMGIKCKSTQPIFER